MLLDNFLEFLRKNSGLSTSTVRCYNGDLKAFWNFSCGEFSVNIVRNYITYLRNLGNSNRTLSRKLSSLRAFCNYLVKIKKIQVDPILGVSFPRIEEKVPRTLSKDLLNAFFNAPDLSTLFGVRDRCMMEVLYGCGIRVSEMCNLNISSVDLTNGKISIVESKGGYSRVVPTTKYVNKWIALLLQHPDRKSSKDIFLNKYGVKITTRSVGRIFENYSKKISLPFTITPHTMRHTLATNLLENGMNISAIKKLLGHKNLSTTSIYTKVSNKLKKQVYDLSHPLGDQFT